MKKRLKTLSIITASLIGGGALATIPFVSTSCGTKETVAINVPGGITFETLQSWMVATGPDSFLKKGQCEEKYDCKDITASKLNEKINETMNVNTAFYAVSSGFTSYLSVVNALGQVNSITGISIWVTRFSNNEIEFNVTSTLNLADNSTSEFSMKSLKKLSIYKVGTLEVPDSSPSEYADMIVLGSATGDNVEAISKFLPGGKANVSTYECIGGPIKGSILESLYPNFSNWPSEA